MKWLLTSVTSVGGAGSRKAEENVEYDIGYDPASTMLAEAMPKGLRVDRARTACMLAMDLIFLVRQWCECSLYGSDIVTGVLMFL